jgi:hypothetical protein
MKDVIVGIAGVVLVCAVVYGCYWVGKTVSYSIFYADMVEKTIVEMVKADALR